MVLRHFKYSSRSLKLQGIVQDDQSRNPPPGHKLTKQRRNSLADISSTNSIWMALTGKHVNKQTHTITRSRVFFRNFCKGGGALELQGGQNELVLRSSQMTCFLCQGVDTYSKAYYKCAKHTWHASTWHAKYAVSRGVWGHAPQKFTQCEIETGSNFNLRFIKMHVPFYVLNNNVCGVLLLSSTCIKVSIQCWSDMNAINKAFSALFAFKYKNGTLPHHTPT